MGLGCGGVGSVSGVRGISDRAGSPSRADAMDRRDAGDASDALGTSDATGAANVSGMAGIPVASDNSHRILLVVPAYNEAENLPSVVADIKAQGEDLDYVIVSDGSQDGTVELCQKRHYSYIALPVNLGLAGCFQAGMKYAFREGYGYAVQMDGDGQHRAADVRALKRKMDEGDYDIVLGSRFLSEKKGGSMREIGSRLLSGAIRLTTGRRVTDPTCGLRMYNRRIIENFANRLNYGPEPDTVSYLIKQGASIAEAPVHIQERLSGQSYLGAWNAAWYMCRMLVSIIFVQGFRK